MYINCRVCRQRHLGPECRTTSSPIADDPVSSDYGIGIIAALESVIESVVVDTPTYDAPSDPPDFGGGDSGGGGASNDW